MLNRLLAASAGAFIAVSAAVVGSATPALASNEVIIKVDPLGWEWSGEVALYEIGCEKTALRGDVPVCIAFGPGKEYARNYFTLKPNAGPQSVYSMDWTQKDKMYVMLENGKLTGGGVTVEAYDKGAIVDDPILGDMQIGHVRTVKKDVPVKISLLPSDGERDGKSFSFYELKFFTEYGPPSLQSLRAAAGAAIADKGNCTVLGTPGDDVLVGTAKDDVICGLGGDDIIYGKGGDDTILAGSGNDTVYGGTGSDKILGAAGRDQLRGGRGFDQVFGGKGRDYLKGTAGGDWLHGGSGKDKVATH